MVTFVQTPVGAKGEDHLDVYVKRNILFRWTAVQGS